MAVSTIIDGVNTMIPEKGDTNSWGTDLTLLLQTIANAVEIRIKKNEGTESVPALLPGNFRFTGTAEKGTVTSGSPLATEGAVASMVSEVSTYVGVVDNELADHITAFGDRIIEIELSISSINNALEIIRNRLDALERP